MTIPAAPVPRGIAEGAALRGTTVMALPIGDLHGDVATSYRAVAGGWRSINGYSGYEPGYYEALRTLSQAHDGALFAPFRDREDVQIIDNATKEDKTDVTLALIISEELRSKPRAIPIATLKALIRHRGERILTQLRETPIGKLIPKEEGHFGSEPPPEAVGAVGEEDMSQGKEAKGSIRATLEQWQSAIDERIRTVLPNFAAFRDLEQEVRRISERLDAIERRLGDRNGGPGHDGA
jgi:hypothetical protein